LKQPNGLRAAFAELSLTVYGLAFHVSKSVSFTAANHERTGVNARAQQQSPLGCFIWA
jgi:hypothetical protein